MEKEKNVGWLVVGQLHQKRQIFHNVVFMEIIAFFLSFSLTPLKLSLLFCIHLKCGMIVSFVCQKYTSHVNFILVISIFNGAMW